MAEAFRSPLADQTADLGRVRMTDESHLAKWRFWDDRYGVEIGMAHHDQDGLVICVAPGEWLSIGDRPDVEDIVDLTHVRAAIRLSGPGARALLGYVCALDLGDSMTPDGAAARTLVAGVAIEIVRDDREDDPSYLLLMSRSFARSVWETLEEAGRFS